MTASLGRVFGNAGWFLGSRGITGLLSLFYLALAARSLGLAGFGQFALVQGLAQAIAGFVTFQTWQIVVRFGMPHLAAGDERRLDGVIGFAALLDVASAVAGTAIAIAAVALLAPVFGWPAGLAWQAGLFCAAMLLSLRSTPIGILRLHDRFALGALGDSVTPVARLIGALLAALLAPTVAAFLIAWAMAEIATAAAIWSLALRCRSPVWSVSAARAAMRDHPGLMRFAWMTNAASSLNLAAKQVTLLLVGGVGGPAAAGAFRIAAQLAQAMAKLNLALSRAVFPELIRAGGIAGGDHAMRRLVVRLTAIAAGGGAVALAVLAFAGPPLLAFIAGAPLGMAYAPMIVLTAAAALDLAGVSLEPALTAHGRAGLALLLRALATATQFASLAVLLPAFGAIGASWAILAGSAVALLLGGFATWRLLAPHARRNAPLAA